MGFAIRSQTIQRLREPLVPTGSSDPRFDRSSSLSALAPWHSRVVQRETGWYRPPFHASSWPISVRPSRCLITAETTRGLDRQKLGKIEFDNPPQGLRCGAVLLIVRQCIQPAAIFHLEFCERGDRIVPALDPAGPIGRPADANDRRAIGVHGTVACLTFGADHGYFADQWTGHWPTPKRYVTKDHTEAASATGGWRRYTSPLVIMAHTVRAILLASATATSLRGLRASSFTSHSVACLFCGRKANRITAVAPVTNNRRNRSLPARLMPPKRCLPPVECSFGVRPIQAARWRPDLNAAGSISIANVSAMITPMPGMVASSWLSGLVLCIAMSSTSISASLVSRCSISRPSSASISLASAGMAVSASMASSNGMIRLIPFPAITPNSAA